MLIGETCFCAPCFEFYSVELDNADVEKKVMSAGIVVTNCQDANVAPDLTI
jgi:hypothetical protein